MNRAKITVFIFICATFLTILTNYYFFNRLSDSKEGASEYELIGEVEFTGPKGKSPWLTYRLNLTLNERERDNEQETTELFSPNSNVPPELFNCTKNKMAGRASAVKTRKTYTVVTNFIVARRDLNCDDPYITYTSHADFRYLDNLVPIVERWQGPVSLTLYIPNKDLYPTLQRIKYLRECTTPLMKEWVTFHLFADTKYFLDPLPVWADLRKVNLSTICSHIPEFNENLPSSRKTRRILYPVNVGRNVARENAQTCYILASDLELYPSLNFIPTFFEMLTREAEFFLNRSVPYVFPLPVFEVEEGYDVPDTREQLLDYISMNVSVTFHRYVCPECHEVPRYNEWLEANTTENELRVFHTAKRRIPYKLWEPIFVSTNFVPFYDERMSWEGLRDKMSQSYTMCLLDYDFMILDNAFLIHKPGIKRKKHELELSRPKYAIRRQNRMLKKTQAEITEKYGKREGCYHLY